MKTKEFIIEFSHTADEITDILRKKGYVVLGNGVDQTAYLEPGTGQVLKIFGTQPGTGTSKYTRDQKMFIFWSEYCKKHINNPFLPHFSGWETFDFHGDKYLQIRMERLTKLPEGMGHLLQSLTNDQRAWTSDLARAAKVRAINRQERVDRIGVSYKYDSTADALSELVILLGQEKYDLLLATLLDLLNISKQKGWALDLHGGNFMHRNDGTPVIVDPWVIDNNSSDMPAVRHGGPAWDTNGQPAQKGPAAPGAPSWQPPRQQPAAQHPAYPQRNSPSSWDR